MTLWQLLMAMCFATPIMGMIASAQKANLRPLSWVIAVAAAAAVGLACALVIWASGRMLAQRVHAYTAKQELWMSRGLYLGGVLWMLSVAALSVWLSSTMVNLVR